MKLKILLCYEYFLPAYKAGGPIQSLTNLIRNLNEKYDFYVITTNKDLGSNEPLAVIPNKWQDFENGKAKVIYLSNEKTKLIYIKKLIREINPDKIMVNGIYSIPFSILPSYFFPNKTIMHVRGMLHPGALSQKSYKKKLFLIGLKWLGIHNKIVFCASDEKEVSFTKAIFGKNSKVKIAQNFPATYDTKPEIIQKEVGDLKLVSIALIGPMKNHALVLEALALVKSNVSWDIYGPIKDNKYWEYCKQLIEALPENIKVTYKGEVNPKRVFETLKDYHFFILPSESENFGHALYESMIAGKPIITSHNTPWNNLEIHNAGYNVELNPEAIALAIQTVANLDNQDYLVKVEATRFFAKNAINEKVINDQYYNLFQIK